MLPKIEHPINEIYLYSLDRKVKFRPFLVKEEKLLLIAKESKSLNDIRTTIRQIIQNCALEPLNVEKLPLFDVEMLFLKLRARSVGESVKLVFNCQNEVEGVPCNTDTDYSLDLEKVEYVIPENHNPKIMINDKIGVKLKYPDLTSGVEINEGDDPYDILIDAILDNIEYIFDADSVYKPEEAKQEQLLEFLSDLTLENMAKVKEFFENAPKVVLEDTVKCKKCGFEHKIHAESLLDFFI